MIGWRESVTRPEPNMPDLSSKMEERTEERGAGGVVGKRHSKHFGV